MVGRGALNFNFVGKILEEKTNQMFQFIIHSRPINLHKPVIQR